MANLDIKLKRANKIYYAGENIKGAIVVVSKNDLSHNGLTLYVEGTVNLHLSAKSVGMFEAFYNSIEIPFEAPLKPKGNKTLYETYHGVFVNIQYSVKCEIKRPILTKDLVKQVEFIIEQPESNFEGKRKLVNFNITPDTLVNVKEKSLPQFKITGKLDTVICNLSDPFTGELTVEDSASTIKSIELQLVRVETCGCAEGYARDATEIQNIQIAEGNVCHNIAIPIYMVFPRLFTCRTTLTSNFKVEFEVNIVITLANYHQITENFPIKLHRA